MNRRLLIFIATALCFMALPAATLRTGNTEIVVAKDAPRTVKFAAGEMKHFLDGVFSCDVPVVNVPTGMRTPIHLGGDKWTKGAGISVDGLARDAFRIVVTDKAVFIAGRDDPKADIRQGLSGKFQLPNFERATAFGVYAFLEDVAGCRFLSQ